MEVVLDGLLIEGVVVYFTLWLIGGHQSTEGWKDIKV